MLKAMAAVLLVASQAMISSAAMSDDYPSKMVRIVVPYAAGGPADILARLIGQKLSEQLGQQFIIDNRPGAAGSIGAGQVARSPADGYTLLVAPIGVIAINPSMYSTLPYDAERDFDAITLLAKSPFLLAVNPNLPAKSLSEFVAYAKSKPGEVKVANPGIGTGQHLTSMNFSMVAGIDTVQVPYRGSAPGTTDLLAGTVDAQFDLAPLLPYVAAGKLRPLAVTSAQRLPSLPDVPTVAESGYPQFEMEAWNSLVAPAGTPRPIIDKLQAAVAAALSGTELRDKLLEQGYIPGGQSPDVTQAFFKNEAGKYGPLVKKSGVVIN
jgi:tripartite-type tricarboxylate transporter receptor subunit TctC